MIFYKGELVYNFLKSQLQISIFVLFTAMLITNKSQAAPFILDGIYGYDIIQSGKTVGAVYAFPGCSNRNKDYVWVYYKSYRVSDNGKLNNLTLQPMKMGKKFPPNAEELIRQLNPNVIQRVERTSAGAVPTEDVGGDSGGITNILDC